MHNTFFRHYKLYMYVYMIRSEIDFHVDRTSGASLLPPKYFQPLSAHTEVDVTTEAGFDRLVALKFATQAERPKTATKKSEEEQEAETQEAKRSAAIKQRVEEGMADLMNWFEGELQ